MRNFYKTFDVVNVSPVSQRSFPECLTMEPMTLGSPVHSPSGPPAFPASPATFGQSFTHAHGHMNASAHAFGTPTGPSAATPNPGGHGYLPGYLMGDQMQQVGSLGLETLISEQQFSFFQGSGRLLSPTKLNRSLSTAPGTPLPHGPQQPHNHTATGGFLTPNTSLLKPGGSHAGPGTPGGPGANEKPGGPPTTGLLFSNVRAASTPKFGTPGRPGPSAGGATSTPVTFATPTGPSVATPNPGGHGYLPGYLMGDQMQQVGSFVLKR